MAIFTKLIFWIEILLYEQEKIIRTVTVSQSLGFCKDVMIKMEKMGYESEVVTSPGKELDAFRKECPQFKAIEVTMERHISMLKDIIDVRQQG